MWWASPHRWRAAPHLWWASSHLWGTAHLWWASAHLWWASAHRWRASAHRRWASAHRRRPPAHLRWASAHRRRPPAHLWWASPHRRRASPHRRRTSHLWGAAHGRWATHTLLWWGASLVLHSRRKKLSRLHFAAATTMERRLRTHPKLRRSQQRLSPVALRFSGPLPPPPPRAREGAVGGVKGERAVLVLFVVLGEPGPTSSWGGQAGGGSGGGSGVHRSGVERAADDAMAALPSRPIYSTVLVQP